MIFLTGASGDVISIADDNISHVDRCDLVGQCELWLRHLPLKLRVKGNSKQVGEEINRQIRGLFGEDVMQ